MSSIPIPMFTEESRVHVTKKACIAAGVPLKTVFLPRSPIKQSLSLSSGSDHAVSASFRENSDENLSSVYDRRCAKSYFAQCFYDVKLIGEGSFGVVFRARAKDDDKLYAVKKSKNQFYSNNDKREKLEEVRKYELIPNHPNCVQLYRSWIEDNFLYLQMELCESTLEIYAAHNHDIPEDILWSILTDMLLAVKNLHDVNLIHLDIKLENILMSSNGVCKLADFGLVSDADKVNSDSLEGDQKYLAPEILNGQFTKAADIFSLGLVMLELSFDLMLPQNGMLWQQLRNDVFPHTCTKNISSELFEVIKKMMASNHLLRPTVDDLLKVGPVQRTLVERNVSRCRVIVISYPVIEETTNNDTNKTPTGSFIITKMVNSTPVHKTTTPSRKWKMNVEISPIQSPEDCTEDSRDSYERLLKKRPHKDSEMSIHTGRKNIQHNVVIPTPRLTASKRSRINMQSSVGRKLFQ